MSVNRQVLTLEEFRKQELRSLPQATGELSNLLRDIALAAKRVNVEVNKAGLVDILGETGAVNIQGESVQRLDELANREFIAVLQRGISCAGITSEEADDFIPFNEELSNQSKYVVVMDPLDGSSNIDVNISIGTIFGVLKRKTQKGRPCGREDFLQAGEALVAAGYVIYGSSTMLVYATRRGVNGFTLDPSIGEFTLSHPDIKCPPDGNTFSINMGYYKLYPQNVRSYIDNLLQNTQAKVPSLRYTGSLVADMHRSLLKGGVFLYPAREASPEGKLRLLYECSPFAFMLEMAGGLATDGHSDILKKTPSSLHQRSPFFAGSRNMMKGFAGHEA